MERRTVLVTGANSGIGLATVLETAGRGLRTVGSVRTPAKAKAVRRAAREAGVEVDTVLLDVTNAGACRRVVEEVRPYALVNNAGYSAMGAIEDVDDEEARRVLETMVVAPMRLARLCLPHMREAGGGRIINLSSIYGRVSTPLTGWYQGCKQALEGLSDALRMEVAADNIRVVLVEPGGFRSGIWADAEDHAARRDGSRYADAYRRSLRATRVWDRFLGDPKTVARVVTRAITARSPGPRQLVGYDAQAFALAGSLVPTPIKDRVVRLTLGL